jgi:hypothetical protein
MPVLLASLTLAAAPAGHQPCNPLAPCAALARHESTRRAWNRHWNRAWNVRWNRAFLKRWHRQHPDPPPVPTGYYIWPWSCIAHFESGGVASTDTGNGFFSGLQFTMSTWLAYGGAGNPADASIPQQEAVANRVLAAQGWQAWPNSSVACGL